MRGGVVFLVFFVFFTLASLVVPIPLFPGNLGHLVFSSSGIPISAATLLMLNAMVNGTLYSFIVWVVFVLVTRKLEEHAHSMISEEREKNKLKVKDRSAAEKATRQECPYFLGYLAKQPRNQPIPNECFGCTRAQECIDKSVIGNMVQVEEALQH